MGFKRLQNAEGRWEPDGNKQGSSKLPSANCHDWIIVLGSTGHREASQFTEERELDWTRGPEQDKMPSLGRTKQEWC